MDHGEEMEVTDLNKVQYLNLLAQYRLCKCVKEETEYFLKGLSITQMLWLIIPSYLQKEF